MKKPGIKEYIAAGAPLLFVRTVETDVAEREIKAQASEVKNDANFGIWKSTTGLQIGNMKDNIVSNEVGGDILRALKYIQDSKKPIIAVFHNVRFFMQNGQVIQQIIDSTEYSKKIGSHIIFVGPFLIIPEELSHLIMFIDMPLPTRKEIEKNFKLMTKAYQSQIKLPKIKEKAQKLIRDAANSAVGLPMSQAENAIALSMATAGKIDIDIIQSQKEQEVKKSDCLEFINTPETMDTVGGFLEFKAWLKRRSKAFTDEARDFGLDYPKGILLVGPPGSGKSLAAKAVATYLKLPLVKFDISRVYGSFVGESEGRMRLALKTIEAIAPVVMWCDELDKGLAGSQSSATNNDGSGVAARVVSMLLTWRAETTYPVMIVATANAIDAIPSTVYRKGRMDEIWSTDLPNQYEREEIFKIHILKRKRNPEKYNTNILAQNTENFVGSEIESCICDGMFYAFDEGTELATRHIMSAIKDTIPQAKRNVQEINKIREWVKNNARYVGSKIEEHISEQKSKISILARN